MRRTIAALATTAALSTVATPGLAQSRVSALADASLEDLAGAPQNPRLRVGLTVRLP